MYVTYNIEQMFLNLFDMFGMVNYFEWSMEYKNTADSIQDVIDRLKAEKRGKSEINKKELDLKIAKYKIYYNECIHISNHLMDRYYGV